MLTAEEGSFDEGSSIIGAGSHKSLAGTSITSTADLSIFSSVTARSQPLDVRSIDTIGLESDDGHNGIIGGMTPIIITRPSPSPDVVRIFVPYGTPVHSPEHSSPHNGDLPYRQENKIRIKVMDQIDDDIETPIVEQNPAFVIESSVIDLK